MEPVVEMWEMETWLTAFSREGGGSAEGDAPPPPYTYQVLTVLYNNH
jgi:hypothetical protein